MEMVACSHLIAVVVHQSLGGGGGGGGAYRGRCVPHFVVGGPVRVLPTVVASMGAFRHLHEMHR